MCLSVFDFRKKAVLISCVPAFIGALLCVVCQLAALPELLMMGRFVTGLNCGVYTGSNRFISAVLAIMSASCLSDLISDNGISKNVVDGFWMDFC